MKRLYRPDLASYGILVSVALIMLVLFVLRGF